MWIESEKIVTRYWKVSEKKVKIRLKKVKIGLKECEKRVDKELKQYIRCTNGDRRTPKHSISGHAKSQNIWIL